MYPTLHEASELKFVDTVNGIARRKKLPTKLQEYDNRAMDINRATGGTLTALSKVLGCQVEDLLEYNYAEVTEE